MANSPPPKPTDQIMTLLQEGAPADSLAENAGETRSQPDAGSLAGGSSSSEELPRRIGRYELKKLLGKGGMGAVYLAHDTHLDRDVALKIPLFFGAAADSMRERFFREARSAATIDHPNICPIHELGEADGVHFLTMAFIEGRPLSTYIHQDAPLPERGVAQIVKQVAEAMEEAHAHGIIHRDLKPANIMINKRKRPIVMDFGLARRGASDDTRITHPGAAMGTPSYMPPEQVNGDVAAMGPTSDIYSLGVVLYELLTGRVPFKGQFGELMAKVIYEAPPPPNSFRPGLSPQLETICLKAIQKAPADRYPTMQALAHDLTLYLSTADTVPVAAAVDACASTEPESSLFTSLVDEIEQAVEEEPRRMPAKQRSSRRPLAVAMLAIVAVVALGAVLILRTEDGEVQIEFSDPKANVEISVDGKVITLKGPSDTFRIKAGPHQMEVHGANFETTTESFVVKSGEKEIVRVTLKPKIVAKRNETRQETSLAVSPQPESVLAWDYRAIHGADSQAVTDWLRMCQTDGWSPADLSVQAGCEEPRFDAIAVRDSNVLPLLFSNNKRGEAGESFGPAIAWRLNAVYSANGGLNELLTVRFGDDHVKGYWFNTDKNRIAEAVQSTKNEGFRVIALQAFHDGSNVVYESRLCPANGIKSQEAWNLTLVELKAVIDKRASEKWRIESLSANNDAWGVTRYFAVFVENREGPAWTMQFDLKPEELTKELAAKRAEGYRPLAIVSHGKKADSKYTVAWLKMAPPPRVPTSDETDRVAERVKRAHELHREQKWKELESECTAALKIDPRNAELLFERSLARIHDGDRWGPAMADITEALIWHPDDSRARSERIWGLMNIAQYELSIVDANKFLAREPKTTRYYRDAFNVKSWSMAKTGEYDQALKLFDEGIKLWPNDAEFLAGRAGLHEVMGNVKSAREDRERASSIDPVIAGRNWSLKSAQPGDARAFDFREIHNADVKALETWYEQMRKENASLCCLSRMAGAGEARFNAIVVFDGNPLPFRLFRYRTDGDLLADPVFKMGISRFTHNVEVVDGKEGLCLLNGDEDHSAGLWFGNADATRQKLEAARNERSRPIVLDNKRIIVSANEGISWKEYQGLTAEEMRAVVRRAASARRRPDLLSAYADEKGAVRFSVVFIDNWGGPEWSYDLALKPAEYERRIPEQKSKGFRPHALISWREGHELRYGCIWLKMAPKLATADAQAEAKRYLDEAIRFERSKDWKRAERACSEALHLDANLLEAHEHRYRARINLERWTSALADVNELIRCNPKDLQWVHNRSWLYLQMDDLDRTIEHADEGIALAVPDSFFHILLLRNKGFAYAKCGQLKKGLEIYNDAASRSPNDATVYFERSSIHEALGNVAEAKADLEKAIEIDANLKTKPPWKFPKKLLPKKTNDGGNE